MRPLCMVLTLAMAPGCYSQLIVSRSIDHPPDRQSCTWIGATLCESSARDRPHGVNEGTMKKRSPIKRKATAQTDADEILPEYDFSRASPNKYASRYAAGSAEIGRASCRER